jgi:uncharacterized protein
VTDQSEVNVGSKYLAHLKNWLILPLVGVAAAVIAITYLTKIPGEETIAPGVKRNSAVYVEMRDGVKIAADIWLPEDFKSGEKLPVVTEMTRYWRAPAVGWLQRAAHGFGLTNVSVPHEASNFNKKRFIYIYIDSRATGASGGNRRSEWDPEEIKDYAELIRWIAQQPWSNGRVGANGVSYSGNTAEFVAASGEPALKAVAPGYDDFDPLLFNAMPGGAFNTGFVTKWSNLNIALDANDICALAETTGLMCWLTKMWTPGVKRVDADNNSTQLDEILKNRKSSNTLEFLEGIVYRDDIGKKAQGISIADVSPSSPAQRPLVEKYKVPMLVFAGWLDGASGEGALRRFATLNTPHEVYLGMFSHGGGFDTDPLAPLDGPLDMSVEKQMEILTGFFEKYLRSEPTQPVHYKTLHYFTAGARTWSTTNHWPISTNPTTLFFGEGNALISARPTSTDATDRYTVDYSASIGKETRYHTQQGGPDVRYPDRKKQGEKLLSYVGEPIEEPLTITGAPIVTVNLASTQSDGVIIAYLETVAPDGTVNYITEGLLRVIHHRETESLLPYADFGVKRSFLRKDASPLIPGEITQIRIPLFSTSIKLPKGYRLKVSLAGAAEGLFDRYPASKPAQVWTVARSATKPSSIELPIVPSLSR